MTAPHYSTAYKACVVPDLLRDTPTIAQIAADTGVHPNQLGKWTALAWQGWPSLFDRRDTTEDLKATHEQEIAALYTEIGRLTTPLSMPIRKLVDHVLRLLIH